MSQTTAYSNKDLTRMVSDLSSELELTKNEILRIKARTPTVTTFTPAQNGFTEVNPMQTVLTVSGTAGDGTYSTGTTIDFNSYVANWAKKVYLQVTTAGAAVSAVAPGFGFRYLPDGWTDYVESYSLDVRDATVDEKQPYVLPLSDTKSGTMYVVKIDNGIGDAWSYTFKIWAYE